MRHERGWCSVDLEDVQIVQGVAAASLCYYQSDRISVASFACVDMNSEPVGLSAATIHIPRYLYHPVIPLSMAVMQSYLPVAFRIQHSNSSCRSRTFYKSQVPALTIPNSRMHANVVPLAICPHTNEPSAMQVYSSCSNQCAFRRPIKDT